MAGTTTSSVDRLGHPKNAVRDLAIHHNKLIDDVANIAKALSRVMPGGIATAPASKTGTSSLKTWRTEAFSFWFRGKLTSAVAQEKGFTATTHDVAASRQAWFALSVQTDGTTFTITKATDQVIGTDVYPTGPDNEIIVALLKVVTTAGGIWDATTDDLATSGPFVASVTFDDTPAIAAAAQLASKIGVNGTAITL